MSFPLFLMAFLVAGSPADGKLFQTDKSPSGRIIAEHFIFEPVDLRSEAPLRQIWLRDAQGKIPPSLLFEHHRGADILFSPNEKWIAISDNPLSDFADVRLFRRSDGLRYKEIEKAEPRKKCWALFDRTSRRSISDKFDHRYVNAIRWAPDSRAVLLIARGYLSGEEQNLYADDWQCVFDVDRLEASRNMKLMSRGIAPKARKP
jgi:hypothetical protein